MIENKHPKEKLYLSIIALVSILIFLGIASLMIYFRLIRFDWTDQLISRYDYSQNKTKEKRILILGDSQLSWWNLDHCLYEDIRQFCKKNEIGYVNTAQGGFGPIEYLDRMRNVGPDYKPNLVLLFYYTGNDLTDVLYRTTNEPKAPGLHWAKQLEFTDSTFAKARKFNPFSNIKDTIGQERQDSFLRSSNFDWNKFDQHGIDKTIIQYAKNRMIYRGKIGAQYVNPHILVMGTWKKDYLYDNNLMLSNESQKAWKHIKGQLKEIWSICNELNAELKLIAIPSTVQVDSSHYDFYRKVTFNVGGDLMESSVPQDALDKWATDFKVQYLNLLPIFKEKNNLGNLYFENDDHLNERGHIVAFNALYDQILKNYLKENKN